MSSIASGAPFGSEGVTTQRRRSALDARDIKSPAVNSPCARLTSRSTSGESHHHNSLTMPGGMQCRLMSFVGNLDRVDENVDAAIARRTFDAVTRGKHQRIPPQVEFQICVDAG